ncbi:4Fe-4S binding protein [Dongia rigui]|uniref:4Fe-4S binding protein n=1 Tax=Dongia rigui TaxID=940149 RepID=A0ABU5E119_9PROT|nr:4Fe-4S binding protein [Dongia rigui]MDY0873204.1 4Fe-4S binding protein [Dongia rigui]
MMTRILRSLLVLGILVAALLQVQPALAKGFGAYLADIKPEEVFPGADHFGPREGNPPSMAAFKGDALLGYVFETADIGYSGKPIRLLVGLDKSGVIRGAKVMEHHEPILLVGIPPEKLTAFVDSYVGRNIVTKVAGDANAVDAISGATVTAIVINDGISRAAMQVAKARGLAGFEAATAATGKRSLVDIPFAKADWQSLLGDGSVRRLHLLNSDVDAAFQKIGVGSPEPYARAGVPTEQFVDLYVSMVSVEGIGRNLLGDAEFERLGHWLKPGQQAILIAANGDYSFRGSGFVRGGIFDRFQLVQDQTSILFKDHDYRRMGDLPDGVPTFKEAGLFRIPDGVAFDPTADWEIKLLAQRPTGPTQKAFTSFPLRYHLPDRFIHAEALAAPAATPAATTPEAAPASDLWKKIWRGRIVDIIILSLSLALLTLIFFFQDELVKKGKLFTYLRVGYLVFSVVWIGGWAQAQLSVVNVLTFTGALVSGGFRWEQFLLEPLIFILWCATAVSLLFWGRGPFCGWLCPFGSLQELLNHLARRIGIRQIAIPFHWHERLWPIKYIIFLGLFGLSLNEFALAEQFAEVEPFKTVVLLRFIRDWPFVVWAVAMLVAGLFIERFFCRYLCPLGAALAIPGRGRLFEWLKRRKQCGFECQLCAKRCPVQAIHPLGQINPNECVYCMQCQVIYWDDSTCPPLLLKKTGRGKKPAPRPTPPAVAAPTVPKSVETASV